MSVPGTMRTQASPGLLTALALGGLVLGCAGEARPPAAPVFDPAAQDPDIMLRRALAGVAPKLAETLEFRTSESLGFQVRVESAAGSHACRVTAAAPCVVPDVPMGLARLWVRSDDGESVLRPLMVSSTGRSIVTLARSHDVLTLVGAGLVLGGAAMFTAGWMLPKHHVSSDDGTRSETTGLATLLMVGGALVAGASVPLFLASAAWPPIKIRLDRPGLPTTHVRRDPAARVGVTPLPGGAAVVGTVQF